MKTKETKKIVLIILGIWSSAAFMRNWMINIYIFLSHNLILSCFKIFVCLIYTYIYILLLLFFIKQISDEWADTLSDILKRQLLYQISLK